jgi:hypothetical protein
MYTKNSVISIKIDDVSLEYKTIKLNDVVQVELSRNCDSGDMIYMYYNGEMIIREVIINNKLVKLIPDKSKNQELIIMDISKLNYLGKVILREN